MPRGLICEVAFETSVTSGSEECRSHSWFMDTVYGFYWSHDSDLVGTCLPHKACACTVCRALVSSPANMHSFATNAVAYLRLYGFDGLDVDWEFPADRGSLAGDKHRFTQLLQVRLDHLTTWG